MAMLIQLDGEVAVRKIPVEKDTVLIGRNLDNDITIDDSAVSSHHARVVTRVLDEARDIRTYHLEDLDSTNGTFLNDKQVRQQQLHNDDIISIAFHEFKFVDENEPDEEQTKKIHKSWIPGIFYTK
ncbi:MAG: FHA domain-containing protein [Gammaproteobacteria bacterium]|nr:FHA domain-containing protein [Gammaproteobacteria bacterium]